jgi:hypothetical protein
MLKHTNITFLYPWRYSYKCYAVVVKSVMPRFQFNVSKFMRDANGAVTFTRFVFIIVTLMWRK